MPQAEAVSRKPAGPDREAESADISSGIPVVGIGGSAGAMEPFKTFFSSMPADSGAAFVVIQHLAPAHESLLPEILAQHTRMMVVQAQDAMPVEPNSVYVIPPNHYLTIREGVLHLVEPIKQAGIRMPIDFFFRSLAEDRRERAICILFSGASSDGTQGVRAVRGEGGLSIAQDPQTAQFDDMPRSAVATGLVDFVLSPDRMAEVLLPYLRHPYVRGGEPEAVLEGKGKPGGLQDILTILQTQSNCDFRFYKKNTILRRIERRMGLHRISDVSRYYDLLRSDADEAAQLCKDLLINVTSFFRDPEVFEELRQKAIAPLKQQADFYQALLERGNEGIVIVKADGSIVYVNKRYAKMLKKPVGKIIGSSFIESISLDNRQSVAKLIKKGLKEKTEAVTLISCGEKGFFSATLSLGPIMMNQMHCVMIVITDISRQNREAEGLLKREKEFSEAIIETVGSIIVVLDTKGRIIRFNKACQEITGYTFEEVKERPFWDFLLLPEEINPVKITFRKLKAGQFPNRFENYWVGKDGMCHLISWSNTALLNDKGRVEYIVGTGIDITDRRKAEIRVQENEELFRKAFENANEGVCLVGIDGRFLKVNQKMAEIFGYSRAELENMTGNDVTYPEDTAISAGVIDKALSGEAEKKVFEKRYVHKNGNIIWAEVATSLIRDFHNTPAYFISHLKDISEKKIAEQALRNSEEEFRSIFELSSIGKAQADPSTGRFLRVNNKLCEISGYAEKELLSMTFTDITHPDDRQRDVEIYKKVLEGKINSWDTEKRYIRKDGSIVWVHVNGTLSRDENGDPYRSAAAIFDITDRKQKEEELHKLNRMLQALSNSDKALIRVTEEAAYLQEVCRIIVEDCGYALVWVGFAEDDENKTVRPVASAGFEEGYLENLKITWADTERGQGPTGTAIRTGKPSICRNMLTDLNFLPWREQAKSRGYASSVVLPLMANGRVFGALNIYSSEIDPFSEDEINMIGAVSVVRDITERRRPKKSYKNSRKN